MDNKLTIGSAGSALLGAGLVKISDNIQVGLALIGVGVLLIVLVAILQKVGLDVKTPAIPG